VGVTIKDVAKHAGVSVCTVSRIINSKPNMFPYSQATRERVTLAAQELGYSPSVLGRGMRAKKTFTVVFALRAENVNHASCVKSQYGISKALMRKGYCLSTWHIAEWHESMMSKVSRFDGIIIGANLPEQTLNDLRACSLPKVELNTLSDADTDYVGQDDFGMAHALGEFLAGLGYRTFVFLNRAGIADYASRRLAGLNKAAEADGIHIDPISHDPHRIKSYLQDHSREEINKTVFIDAGAIAEVSATFYIGMGVGMEAPRDFGLATCHLEPPDASFDGKKLTGVFMDAEQKAEVAGEMLIEKMKDNGKPKPSVLFPHKVIRGNTTRKVD